MIPKNIYFIWFGDNKPKYVDFCVNIFKEVNKDFEVDLISYNNEELDNIRKKSNFNKYDSDIIECLDFIEEYPEGKYNESIALWIESRSRNRLLSNLLRLHILNKYGGIYLDCDTFPLKPFDNWLLNKKSFCSYTFWKSYQKNYRNKDCNFLGKELSDKKIYNYFNYSTDINVNEYKFYDNREWINRGKLFYNCLLDYKEYDTEYYIEHYPNIECDYNT